MVGGRLVGTTASLQGDIRNDAAVTFDQASAGTYTGTMAGTGSLTKAGAGTLTLTGRNTYSGGTFVVGGRLVGTTASLQGNVLNNAAVTVDQAFDGTFRGTIGGSGRLTKSGLGLVTLLGAHSFTGQTDVAAGTLALEGSLAGGVSVQAGASFQAQGAVLGSVAVAGRLLVPGLSTASSPSPGLLVGGDLVATRGSSLSLPVRWDAAPAILAAGSVDLTGTRIEAAVNDLGGSRSRSFLALTALRGLTATDLTFVAGRPQLDAVLRRDGHSLLVTLLDFGVPLAGAASTANAAAAGAALDRLKGDLNGDRGGVIRELTALDDGNLDRALRQVAGEVHASSRHLAISGSAAFTDTIRDQWLELPSRGGRGARWWGQLARARAGFSGRHDVFGGTVNSTEAAVGANWRVSERWLAGAGGGVGTATLGLDGPGGSSEVTSPRAFAVLAYQPDGIGVRGGASVSRSSYDSRRRIAFVALLPEALGGAPLTGGIEREAVSSWAAWTTDGWAEVADRVDLGGWRFQYVAGVRHARFSRQGFVESGAGALSLEASRESFGVNEADVKLHWSRRAGRVRPYVATLFRRSSGVPAATTVWFAGAEGSRFETGGLRLGKSLFSGRTGITLGRAATALSLEYRFRAAAGLTVHAADIRVGF